MKINRRKFLIGSSLMLVAGGGALAQPAASAEEDASLEKRLAADPHRPQYHLLPAANHH